LEEFARQEEDLACRLACLAAELEWQGQAGIAAMFRQASQRNRISSARNRAVAAAADEGDIAVLKPTFPSRVFQP